MRKYLVRYLEIYHNDEDNYMYNSMQLTVDEKTISGVTVDDLKTIFKLRKKDPNMYTAYRIKKKQANFFETKLNMKLDFKKYIYVIQACLVNENEL